MLCQRILSQRWVKPCQLGSHRGASRGLRYAPLTWTPRLSVMPLRWCLAVPRWLACSRCGRRSRDGLLLATTLRPQPMVSHRSWGLRLGQGTITRHRSGLGLDTLSTGTAHPVGRGLSGRTTSGTDVLVFRPCRRIYDRLMDRWEATLARLDGTAGHGSIVVLVLSSHQTVRAGYPMLSVRNNVSSQHDQRGEAQP